jgi:hypothetical protein
MVAAGSRHTEEVVGLQGLEEAMGGRSAEAGGLHDFGESVGAAIHRIEDGDDAVQDADTGPVAAW